MLHMPKVEEEISSFEGSSPIPSRAKNMISFDGEKSGEFDKSEL